MSELFATEPVIPPTEAEGQSAFFADLMPTSSPAAHYRVLARKYRPTMFSELIGQAAVVRTLTNAIAANRLPHAWILTGVRGIGKTTTARIIARALNCTGPDGKGEATINPCGVCDSCRAIADDRHVDVMEMDAASRTGVDDIRDIVDGVRYGPVSARYKIYILDEVHMLSKNAFNALLKTLEEPPPHAKFIFATTEIRKVPVTILSRCQRFDLRRVESDVLTTHFLGILQKESVTGDEEAVRLIASAADGSVRDGLSLLDQAIALGQGHIALDDVRGMLGLADRAQTLDLCRQLLRGEMPAALAAYDSVIRLGADPLQVLQDLCDHIHMLTRAQAVPDYAKQPHLPEYDRDFLASLTEIGVPALTRAWQILLKGIAEVLSAPQPVKAAEMVLIRLAYAAPLPPPGDLVKKLMASSTNTGAASGGASSPSGDNSAPRMRMAASGGSAGAVSAVAVDDVATPSVSVIPANYRALVALFSERREAGLHAYLYSQAYPVRYEAGHLELGLISGAPQNFGGRISQCLTAWTGQRWLVTLAEGKAGKTLADEDKAVEAARQAQIMAHPLVQAALTAFPDAKVAAIRSKTLAPVATSGENEDIGTELVSDEIINED